MNALEDYITSIKKEYSRITGRYSYRNGSRIIHWKKLPWEATIKIRALAFTIGAIILIAAAFLGIVRGSFALTISPALMRAARENKQLRKWRQTKDLSAIPEREKKLVRTIINAAVAGNGRAQEYASNTLGIPEDKIVTIGKVLTVE